MHMIQVVLANCDNLRLLEQFRHKIFWRLHDVYSQKVFFIQ